MSTVSLQPVMDQLHEHFVFDGKSYPTLRSIAPPGASLPFIANHSLLHMAKTQGKLAASLEACDHNARLDLEAVNQAVVNMFIHTLVLASELGMSAEDLVRGVSLELQRK